MWNSFFVSKRGYISKFSVRVNWDHSCFSSYNQHVVFTSSKRKSKVFYMEQKRKRQQWIIHKKIITSVLKAIKGNTSQKNTFEWKTLNIYRLKTSYLGERKVPFQIKATFSHPYTLRIETSKWKIESITRHICRYDGNSRCPVPFSSPIPNRKLPNMLLPYFFSQLGLHPVQAGPHPDSHVFWSHVVNRIFNPGRNHLYLDFA